MIRLLSDAARLIESWWKIDRVRVSPREGRLLRLTPPCVVVVEDHPAEVLARTLGRASATTNSGDDDTISVTYECRGVDGACRLRITITPAGAVTAVYWTTDGRERRIAEESVEVYAP